MTGAKRGDVTVTVTGPLCPVDSSQKPVEPPRSDDYYVMDDLADRAISWMGTQKALDPERPFFLQMAFPGVHSPLQVRGAERDRFKGQYDKGWDAIRAARLQKQKALGIVPQHTKLPPLSASAKPWDGLSAGEKALYARYMEVYAAMLANLDANVGRLMQRLDDLGIADNTMVLLFSDNGGSAEGTPTGTPNVFAAAYGRPVPVADAEKLYDVMGEDPTFPHYPVGWTNASNTPYRLYKQYTHLGGVADPTQRGWSRGTADPGGRRRRPGRRRDRRGGPDPVERRGAQHAADRRDRGVRARWALGRVVGWHERLGPRAPVGAPGECVLRRALV